jgi:hypothetical protein
VTFDMILENSTPRLVFPLLSSSQASRSSFIPVNLSKFLTPTPYFRTASSSTSRSLALHICVRASLVLSHSLRFLLRLYYYTLGLCSSLNRTPTPLVVSPPLSFPFHLVPFKIQTITSSFDAFAFLCLLDFPGFVYSYTLIRLPLVAT